MINQEQLVEIKMILKSGGFEIPVKSTDLYFPDYLKQLLENYLKISKEKFDNNSLVTKSHVGIFSDVIKNVNEIIVKTVDFYYKGKTNKAREFFLVD